MKSFKPRYLVIAEDESGFWKVGQVLDCQARQGMWVWELVGENAPKLGQRLFFTERFFNQNPDKFQILKK